MKNQQKQSIGLSLAFNQDPDNLPRCLHIEVAHTIVGDSWAEKWVIDWEEVNDAKL